ncbi:MAG: 6-phosphogluconolactonase [Actinomycetota bacterium]
MTPPRVVVLDDEDAVAVSVADALAARLALPGEHHAVLTGGGVGTRVLAELLERCEGIDWERVHLWWGDERFLPAGDAERNETGARAALIDAIPIPPGNVHPMPADVGQGLAQAALAYADELARASHDGFVPDFDVLLLGMGPEGHVASLFPGMPALHDAASTAAIDDSPKPPPSRVTLTLAAIRASREVWVVAAGAAKAEAAAAAIAPGTLPDAVPAAGARGRESTVFWLDRAAAAEI